MQAQPSDWRLNIDLAEALLAWLRRAEPIVVECASIGNRLAASRLREGDATGGVGGPGIICRAQTAAAPTTQPSRVFANACADRAVALPRQLRTRRAPRILTHAKGRADGETCDRSRRGEVGVELRQTERRAGLEILTTRQADAVIENFLLRDPPPFPMFRVSWPQGMPRGGGSARVQQAVCWQ